MRFKGLLIFFVFGFNVLAFSQDTAIFINNDQIIGKVKSLDKGVLTFETDYSNSDFKIEWKRVKKLSTSSIFLITLSDGTRHSGSISRGDSTGLTLRVEGGEVTVGADDIVYLKSLDDGFWSQVYAHIDIGLSLTKAQNLKQLNMSSGFGYLGEKWSWDARFNSLNSDQDSVQATRRTDGGVSANLFLPKDWFLTAATDYLSNTEQLLDLRLNGRLGYGYYVHHSNRWYWSFAGGLAYVNETYSSGESNKESLEAFIGTDLNLFDVGDFSLYTKTTAYPGITERGRFRADFKLDLKYDLPLDFYLKGGFTLNYDNQPTAGAGDVDYVLTTGFGWEW